MKLELAKTLQLLVWIEERRMVQDDSGRNFAEAVLNAVDVDPGTPRGISPESLEIILSDIRRSLAMDYSQSKMICWHFDPESEWNEKRVQSSIEKCFRDASSHLNTSTDLNCGPWIMLCFFQFGEKIMLLEISLRYDTPAAGGPAFADKDNLDYFINATLNTTYHEMSNILKMAMVSVFKWVPEAHCKISDGTDSNFKNAPIQVGLFRVVSFLFENSCRINRIDYEKFEGILVNILAEKRKTENDGECKWMQCDVEGCSDLDHRGWHPIPPGLKCEPVFFRCWFVGRKCTAPPPTRETVELKEEIDSLEDNIRRKEDFVTTLERTLQDAVDGHKSELESAQTEMEGLQASIREKDETISALDGTRHSLTDRVRSLESQLESTNVAHRTQLELLQESIQEREQSICSLRQNEEKLNVEVKTLQEEAQALQASIRERDKENVVFRDDREKLKLEVDTMKRKLEKLQASIKEKEQENRALCQNEDKLKLEVVTLKGSIQEKEQENRAICQNEEKLKLEVVTLKRKLEKLQASIKEKEQENLALCQNEEKLKLEVENLKGEVNTLQEECSSLRENKRARHTHEEADSQSGELGFDEMSHSNDLQFPIADDCPAEEYEDEVLQPTRTTEVNEDEHDFPTAGDDLSSDNESTLLTATQNRTTEQRTSRSEEPIAGQDIGTDAAMRYRATDPVDFCFPESIIPGSLRSQQTIEKGHCPWCGELLLPDVDLLGDLDGVTKDQKLRLVEHELKNSCMFWGLRVTDRNADGNHSLRYLILNAIRTKNGLGARKKSDIPATFIRELDTMTKDSFRSRLHQIMFFPKKEAEAIVVKRSYIQGSPPPVFRRIYMYIFNGKVPKTGEASSWVREIVVYFIAAIHTMMRTKIDTISSAAWSGLDKGRLVNDANLSLFNFYYFWHASIFYNASAMDLLLPLRDLTMTNAYIRLAGRMRSGQANSSAQIIKGTKGAINQNGSQLFSICTPGRFTSIDKLSPAEKAIHIQMGLSNISSSFDWIFRENNRSVILPKRVVTFFPYWLSDTPTFHAGYLNGWECGDPNCLGRVFHLGCWCFFCRKVFCCESLHLMRHDTNEAPLKCHVCQQDLGRSST